MNSLVPYGGDNVNQATESVSFGEAFMFSAFLLILISLCILTIVIIILAISYKLYCVFLLLFMLYFGLTIEPDMQSYGSRGLK